MNIKVQGMLSKKLILMELAGEMDGTSFYEFKKTLEDVLGLDPMSRYKLVIDLDNVTYVDPLISRIFVHTLEKVRRKKMDFRLVYSAQSVVHGLFDFGAISEGYYVKYNSQQEALIELAD